MDNLPINITDIAIVAVVVISGVFALLRGLVHEVLAVVSWIGAGFATLYGFSHVLPYFQQFITVELFAEVAAAITIFLVVLVVLSIATRMLSQRVKDSSLGPLDRTLGMLFGFARGAVIVCVAWLAYAWLIPEPDRPAWIEEARSKPLVIHGAVLLQSLIPQEYRGQMNQTATDALGKARAVQDANQNFRDIVSPQPRAETPEKQPEYNRIMREQMRRAIEAAGDQEPRRQEQVQ